MVHDEKSATIFSCYTKSNKFITACVDPMRIDYRLDPLGYGEFCIDNKLLIRFKTHSDYVALEFEDL